VLPGGADSVHGRLAAVVVLLILSIIITLNVPPPKPANLSQILSPGSESYMVSQLAGKRFGGATLVVVTNASYLELPDDFGLMLNSTLKKLYNVTSTMDYYTLKKMVHKKLNASISQFIVRNYKYIEYLKDLVEQLDGIGIYMYDVVSDAWKVYRIASDAPQLYKSYIRKWNIIKDEINNFEAEFYEKEQRYTVETAYYAHKALQLLNKAVSVVIAFNETRNYYIKAFKDLTNLTNVYCSLGELSIRKIAEALSTGQGYEGTVRRLMAQALISTWIGWQGEPCVSNTTSPDFLTSVLAYFVSLAPQTLSKSAGEFNLTEQEMKNIVLLATTLSPDASPKEVKDALLEAIRVSLRISPATASLLIKSLEGEKKAFAALVVSLMKVEDPCFAEAIFESVARDAPLVMLSQRCEIEGIRKILERAPRPRDPNAVTSIIAQRGMDSALLKYEALYTTLATLMSHGIMLNDSMALVYSKADPASVLSRYLKSNNVIYPQCVVDAVKSSNRLVEAQKKAIVCVYRKLAKVITSYGFSNTSVNTMIYSIIAFGPGLTREQVNEVVYKTILTELQNLNDPRLRLLERLTDIKLLIRKIVWSESATNAINSVSSDVERATERFIQNYVALDLLVGKDGRHLVFTLSKDIGKPPDIGYDAFFLSPKWINEEIKRSMTNDINFVNKIGTVLVFIALLLTLRSLKLAFVPVIIIYAVLQYYKIILALLAALGIRPTSIDMVVATATILGMGIDYSLFTVARYKKGAFFEAVRPVLTAASLASAGFLVFGLVSSALLPSLSSIGLFVPLAIMFTAIIGPAITVLFKEVLNTGGRIEAARVSVLTAMASESPRTVLLLTALIVMASAYLIIMHPPGYDVYLFLPENAESVKALKILQEYSSPGIIGPTIVLLKPSTNDMKAIANDIEALSRYFIESGYFDYAFTYTRPLGKFVSTDPEILKLVGANTYIKNGWIAIYLLPKDAPDSSSMVNYVREMRKFLKDWIRNKPFEAALVGGESAINYDISVAVNKITLNYVIPIMTIISVLIFVLIFRRLEIVLPASATSLVSMIVVLGLSIFLISIVMGVTTLWMVIPLAITVVLSVGTDYSVFYFFGLKSALEECKIVEEGECVHKLNAVYYNAAKMYDLIMGFALTFAVAYFSLLISNIWALKELGLSLGIAPLLLVLALFTLVPAILSILWR